MPCIFDLHIHSNYSSDGYYKPSDIYKRVIEKEIKYFAITDHNEINGSRLLAEEYSGIGGGFLIPAVEISVWYKKEEIHLLAYGINYDSIALNNCLNEYKSNIPIHTALRCEALRKAGFYIDEKELEKEAKSLKPSTVTILNTMRKDKRNDKLLYEYFYGKKSSATYMNFYLDYNAYGKPAYVDFSLLDYNKTVESLKNEAFLSIAHPMHYSENILEELFIDGIRGIEAYSTYKLKKPLNYYIELSKKFNLTITGGSDFHGETLKPNIEVGDVKGTINDFKKIQESLIKYSSTPFIELRQI